ncbi:hypothetical protein [Mycolicibacterium holsaticum]|jgi:hypothetical protein|uniref:hypothetical protein n=1 Tax=Mycolicibacterium holsaticum TaxID=152142 RepID=UPI001C7CDBE9|nr:hypothetical protein [Mycolicibacterium holsaticum]MDA4106144.1 hypothetical protein [Mycolicibacterium holsaticum DSM 44478 = JCM 12374]QZA13531.1 hypothetical protein K3U96_05040 [Mycolicibacterium holsaticum DSM 44478 = JCM 12374]UNC09004.1 hypothetical protein H5U41_21795 [Mycolicibacterium holsaticum DSM 44478 = JCM 12374]
MADPSKRSREAIDRIFGDSLPSKETDEDDISTRTEDLAHEHWLRENVPPHHD